MIFFVIESELIKFKYELFYFQKNLLTTVFHETCRIYESPNRNVRNMESKSSSYHPSISLSPSTKLTHKLNMDRKNLRIFC